MLENFFGRTKCFRCGEKNDKQTEFCHKCGISLGFDRPAILNDNRWEAADDELAVFFKSHNLKGLFSKPLRVPAGMRAWILQDNKAEDLLEGEYAVETLLERVNSLFRGNHAEIIITRNNSMPVRFVFEDILSAELLEVRAETTVYVRVGDTTAFRTYFMQRPGVVTATQLNALLKDSVRQIIAENLGARRLEEMSAHGSLRQDLDKALLVGLQHRFQGYGLAFDQVDTISVRHDRFDANRQLKGSYWMSYNEKLVEAEHKKAMNELYSQEELENIRAEEEALRLRYRRAELKQEEAEKAQVIRLREVDLYKKVMDADTRKKAIDIEAGEQVEVLEQQYKDKRRQREKDVLKDAWKADDERAAWLHTQAMARIKYEEEMRAAEVDRDAAQRLARQRIENTLERLRIEGEIEQARLVDDEAERKRLLTNGAELLLKNALRDQSLLETTNQVEMNKIIFAGQVHERTENRVQAWEDKQLEQKIALADKELAEKCAEIDIRIAAGKSEQGIKGLTSLLEVDKLYEANELELEEQRKSAALRLEIKRYNELELVKKQKEQELAEAAKDKQEARDRARRQDDLEAAAKEREWKLQHMAHLGALSGEALITICDPDGRETLLEAIKHRYYAEMTPEKITASQGAEKAKTSSPIPEGPLYGATASAGSATASTSDALVEELRISRDRERDMSQNFMNMQARAHEEAQRNQLAGHGITGEAAKAFANSGTAHNQTGQAAYTNQSQFTQPQQPPPGQGHDGGQNTEIMTCLGCKRVFATKLSICPHCNWHS